MGILGPTASGKSQIAEAAAVRFGASILSVDSMQVYRRMDIGTAKPSPETRRTIEHHLIDVVDASAEFSVAEFQRLGRTAIANADAAGGRVIIAGGSGLHYRAVVDPMTFGPTDATIRADLEARSLESLQQELLAIDFRAPDVLDLANPRRVIRALEIWHITSRTPTERAESTEARNLKAYVPMVEHKALGVDPREDAHGRAKARFTAMLDGGFVVEVAGLASLLSRTSSQAVGYKELLPVTRGECSLEEGTERALQATRALIKRQRTYFRRDPRIEWMPWIGEKDARIEAAVNRIGEVTGWTS